MRLPHDRRARGRAPFFAGTGSRSDSRRGRCDSRPASLRAMSEDGLRVLVVGRVVPVSAALGLGGARLPPCAAAGRAARRDAAHVRNERRPRERGGARTRRGIHGRDRAAREAPTRLARRKDQLASLVSRRRSSPYIDPFARDAGRDRPVVSRASRSTSSSWSRRSCWPFRFPDGTQIVLDEHNIEYENYARMREGTSSPLRKAFY